MQASQGIELTLPLDFSLTTTAFVQNYLNLTDQFATCITTSGNQADGSCVSQRVRGRGYGLEVLLRRDLTKRITGWISYTLSRSTRETTGPHVVAPNGVELDLPASSSGEVLAEFDRTHVFNLVAAADLGQRLARGGALLLLHGQALHGDAHQRHPAPAVQPGSPAGLLAHRLPPGEEVDASVSADPFLSSSKG